MSVMKLILGIIAISALIIGGAYALKSGAFNRSKEVTTTPAPLQSEQNMDRISSSSATVPTKQQFEEREVITVTKNGFEPINASFSVGTLVQWINKSGGEVSVNSADHPTHQLYPFLNLGIFPDGSSVSVVFEKADTYKYHDHLHPERVGTITVK